MMGFLDRLFGSGYRLNKDRITEWLPDLLGILMIVVGLFGYIDGPLPYNPWLTPFFQEIRSDLIGIGLAVLIIDNANQFLATRQEKKRLILQMGSPDNSFAIEAVRQLRIRGWLSDGSLKGAFLESANLENADLHNANMQVVKLIKANLLGAKLFEADRQGANISYANLEKAMLMKANLQGAELLSTILQGAQMQSANLQEASLLGANLQKVSLLNSNLQNANLSDANLSGAYMVYADLRGAYLSRANMQNAKITEHQWEYAKSLEEATMPDGKIYNPAIHGPTKSNGQ